MNIVKEVKKLTEKLINYARVAEQNPNYKGIAKKNCQDEIEIAQILISAKSKSTPLATQTMFKMALDRQMPQEVKKLLFQE